MRKGPASRGELRPGPHRADDLAAPSGLLEPQIHKESTPSIPAYARPPASRPEHRAEIALKGRGLLHTPHQDHKAPCASPQTKTQGPRHTTCTHRVVRTTLRYDGKGGAMRASCGEVPHGLRAITQDE